MTECFLLPTSSPSERCQTEHSGGLPHTPSSEEIPPTKFPVLNSTLELLPPQDCLYELPDTGSDEEDDDEKAYEKKKGKFKKKEKKE